MRRVPTLRENWRKAFERLFFARATYDAEYESLLTAVEGAVKCADAARDEFKQHRWDHGCREEVKDAMEAAVL